MHPYGIDIERWFHHSDKSLFPLGGRCALCMGFIVNPYLSSCDHTMCGLCHFDLLSRSHKVQIEDFMERKIHSTSEFRLQLTDRLSCIHCRQSSEFKTITAAHLRAFYKDIPINCGNYKLGCTATVMIKDIMKHEKVYDPKPDKYFLKLTWQGIECRAVD